MEDGPRVFEDGAVTLVLGSNGAALYAGAHRVTTFSSVRADVGEDGSVRMEVRFSRSHDPDVGLRIEENKRLLGPFPWATVKG